MPHTLTALKKPRDAHQIYDRAQITLLTSALLVMSAAGHGRAERLPRIPEPAPSAAGELSPSLIEKALDAASLLPKAPVARAIAADFLPHLGLGIVTETSGPTAQVRPSFGVFARLTWPLGRMGQGEAAMLASSRTHAARRTELVERLAEAWHRRVANLARRQGSLQGQVQLDDELDLEEIDAEIEALGGERQTP